MIENPKKSVLLKLGWYTEDSDSKPIVCYLTYLDSEGKKTDGSANHIRFTSDIVSSEIYVNPMPCTITERMRREGEILVY